MAIDPCSKTARIVAPALIGLVMASAASAQERVATTFVADRVEGHLSQAARYEDKGDYKQAAQEYLKAQKAIGELQAQHPERRFVTGVSERVEWGLERAIATRIRSLPPEGLEVYRLAAEPRARLAYKLAAKTFDLPGLRLVALRYPETAAAAEAEVALANWSLESGRVREAAALFLEQAGDDPAGLLRAAACYKAIGDASGLERARRLFAAAGQDPAQHEVFAGLSARKSADGFKPLPRLGRLTRVTELASPELDESLAESAGALLPYQIPVFDPSGERFYIADSKTVRGFSAGPRFRALWNFSVASPSGEPERLEVSAFAPAVAGELVIATLNRNRPPRRVLKKAPEGQGEGENKDEPEREPKDDPEKPDEGAQPGEEKEDRKSRDPDDIYEFLRAQNWRVVAIDAKTGLLRWDLGESDAFEEFARKAEWISPPSVGPDGIYLTVTLQNNSLQAVLLKVSLEGELLWSARLASRSPLNHRGLAGPLPPPLLLDGRVFVETSIGIVAAVEAGRGRVEWVHHYPVFPDRSQPTIVDEDRRIRVAPSVPARARGLIIAAPVDSPYILAFRQADGRLAWRLERGSAAFIAPGPDDELILAGDRLTAVDRNTGLVLRQSEALSSAVTAPPLVDRECLLVPLTDRVLRVGRADFRISDQLLTEGMPGRLARLNPDHVLAVRPRSAALIESPQVAQQSLRALADFDKHYERALMFERRELLEDAETSLGKALDTRYARDDPDLRLNAHKARMRVRFALGEQRLEAKRFVAFVSLSEKGLEDAAQAAELEARVRDDADPNLAIARARQLKRLGDLCGAHPAARYARKAADAFQALLATADRLILNHGDGVDVDSHAYAALRLRELIRRHGAEVYADHERAAVQSAAEARKAGSSEQMRAVIDRYPVSRAAAELRLDLALLYRKQRLLALSGKVLEDFLAEHAEHPRAPEALAMLALSCHERGRDLEARRALEELSSRYPEARVKDENGQSSAVPAFAQRLGRKLSAISSPQAMTDDIHAASLRTPLQRAFRIEADLDGINTQLVKPSPQQPLDLFLLRRGDTLEGRFPDTGAVSWRVDDIAEFNDNRQPLPHDGLLLLPLRELIAAIDIQTGDLAWSYAPEIKDPKGEAIIALFGDGKRAYCITADSHLVALNPADGSVLWRRKEPGKLTGHGAARNNTLVFAINEPAALAFFDPESGDELERVVLSQGVAAQHTHPLLATADRIITTTTERKTLGVDPQTRKVVFSLDVADLGRVRELVVAKDESSFTLLGRQSIADKAALMTIATIDGSLMWTDDGSGAVGALRRAVSKAKITEIKCVDNAIVTVRQQSMRSNEVWSQELDTGKRSWSWKMPEGQTAKTLIETPSQLFVPFGGQMTSCPIAILSKGNGRQVERPEVFGRKVIDAGVVNGTFLVLTDRGQFAFAHLDQAAIDRDIVEILDFIEEARKKGPPPAALTALLADRLQKAGRLDPAIEVLVRDLLAEDINKASYDRLYAQLCALLELKVEQQVPRLKIRRLTKPADIDGELSDWWRGWSSFTMRGPRHVRPIQVEPDQTPGTWKGQEDLSAKVYVAYDEKNLYFAVDVEDTDLRPFDSEADNWIGDCLLISIDCLNNGGNYYARDDLFLSLALTKPRKKKKNNDEQQRQRNRNRPEGKYFVRQKDDRSGAIYECKIPWTMLTEKGASIDEEAGPPKGFEFGFNITLTDDDGERGEDGEPRGALKSISWTPGIRLHTRRNRLFQGYLPRFFGKVIID